MTPGIGGNGPYYFWPEHPKPIGGSHVPDDVWEMMSFVRQGGMKAWGLPVFPVNVLTSLEDIRIAKEESKFERLYLRLFHEKDVDLGTVAYRYGNFKPAIARAVAYFGSVWVLVINERLLELAKVVGSMKAALDYVAAFRAACRADFGDRVKFTTPTTNAFSGDAGQADVDACVARLAEFDGLGVNLYAHTVAEADGSGEWSLPWFVAKIKALPEQERRPIVVWEYGAHKSDPPDAQAPRFVMTPEVRSAILPVLTARILSTPEATDGLWFTPKAEGTEHREQEWTMPDVAAVLTTVAKTPAEPPAPPVEPPPPPPAEGDLAVLLKYGGAAASQNPAEFKRWCEVGGIRNNFHKHAVGVGLVAPTRDDLALLANEGVASANQTLGAVKRFFGVGL